MTTFTVAQFLSAEAQGIALASPEILDTSANVAANLDALEPFASKIGPIQFTDATTPTISLSVTQDTNDAAAIADFQGQYTVNIENATVANAFALVGNPHFTVQIIDTAANIQASLDHLETIVSSISSIEIGSFAAVTVTLGQLSTDLAVIEKLSGGSGLAISGNITLAQAIEAVTANVQFNGLNVVDSASDVQSGLSTAINYENNDISSITLTDAGTPTISVQASAALHYTFAGDEFLYNFSIFSTIETPYNLNVEDVPISIMPTKQSTATAFTFGVLDTAADVQSKIDFLESLVLSHQLTSITLSNTNNTAPLTFTPAQQIVDAGAIALIQGSSNSTNPSVYMPADPNHGIITEDGPSYVYQIIPSADGEDFIISQPLGTNLYFTNATASTTTYVQFTDITMVVANPADANLARLYSAALDRTPDQAGLDGWMDIYNNNVSAATKTQGVYVSLGEASGNFNGSLPIAYGFINSAEFQHEYGSLNNNQFVTQLYANVLDRTPDGAGLAGWLSLMQTGGYTQGMVLVGFAESAENIAKDASWLVTV